MRRRQQKAVAYRLTYTGATVVLATLAAKVVAADIQPGIVGLPSGGLTAVAIVTAAAGLLPGQHRAGGRWRSTSPPGRPRWPR